jgi:hypothetical protein
MNRIPLDGLVRHGPEWKMNAGAIRQNQQAELAWMDKVPGTARPVTVDQRSRDLPGRAVGESI